MKYLNKYVLSASLMMTSLCGSLQADTFSFKYVFFFDPNDPNVSTVPGEFYGELTGVQNGNMVDGVVVTKLGIKTYEDPFDVNSTALITEIDGSLVSIFNHAWDDSLPVPNWGAEGGAAVSFDLSLNNFIFTVDDLFDPNLNEYTQFAYLLIASGGPAGVASSGANVAYDGGEGEWTLTNLTPPPVPEGGTTVALLGLALVGFAGLRRKRGAR